MTALTLPLLSISMEEAKVLAWLVEDGDDVIAGTPVVEIETDKATVQVEAPGSGRIRIVAPAGATLPVDALLAEIDDRPAAIEVPVAAARHAGSSSAPASARRLADSVRHDGACVYEHASRGS